MKKKQILLATLILLSMLLLLSGCGSQTVTAPQTKAPDAPVAPAPAPPNGDSSAVQPTIPITVYFADKNAEHLVPVVHRLDRNAVGDPARAAVELLLMGTKNVNLINVIPPDTRLKSLVVRDRVAYVDFSKNIIKRGGSTEETFLVASVVDTLTEFPNIEKVQFLVEGKKVGTLFGQVDVSEPLSRSEKIIKK